MIIRFDSHRQLPPLFTHHMLIVEEVVHTVRNIIHFSFTPWKVLYASSNLQPVVVLLSVHFFIPWYSLVHWETTSWLIMMANREKSRKTVSITISVNFMIDCDMSRCELKAWSTFHKPKQADRWTDYGSLACPRTLSFQLSDLSFERLLTSSVLCLETQRVRDDILKWKLKVEKWKMKIGGHFRLP